MLDHQIFYVSLERGAWSVRRFGRSLVEGLDLAAAIAEGRRIARQAADRVRRPAELRLSHLGPAFTVEDVFLPA